MTALDETQREALHSLYNNPVSFGGEILKSVKCLEALGLAENVPGEWADQYRLTEVGRNAKADPANEPEWLRAKSPHERKTSKEPWKRTEADYLVILSERPDARFGEYDNTALLFDMGKRGLIMLDPSKQSVFTSMFTSLHYVLTDAGRAALKEE